MATDNKAEQWQQHVPKDADTFLILEHKWSRKTLLIKNPQSKGRNISHGHEEQECVNI